MPKYKDDNQPRFVQFFTINRQACLMQYNAGYKDRSACLMQYNAGYKDKNEIKDAAARTTSFTRIYKFTCIHSKKLSIHYLPTMVEKIFTLKKSFKNDFLTKRS